MRLAKDTGGQTLVISAVAMSLLMGFLALAVDVGTLFRARRNMQIAADAAATAAALDYKYNTSVSSARTAGQTAALANGVTDVSYVTVNSPPASGYHMSAGYFEAVINQPTQTFFMRMFGVSSVDVYGRAVMGSGANSGCIWALATSGADVTLTGAGSVTAQNCNIYDDSSAADALVLTGAGSISAKEIGIVGGYSRTGSGTIHPNPPTTGIAPAGNPLNLSPPTIPTGRCTGGNCNPLNVGSGNLPLGPGTYTSITNVGSGNITFSPGNYIITGSITNTGSGQLIFGAGNYTIGGDLSSTGSTSVTLGAGLYTIGGNLTLTGSGPLTGNGVTFYTIGSVTVTGSGSMNLSAPTSGTYSGVLFYQPNAGAVALTGSGGDKVQGILYAPKSALTLTGSGSLTVSLDLIVDSLTVTGTGAITDTNYAAVTNTSSVLGKLAMVE